MMLSISSTASGFSILAITLACFPRFLIIACNCSISDEVLTKERPIQSTFSSKAKSKSTLSLSVIHGREIIVFGRFNPFLGRKIPPLITLQITSDMLSVERTSNLSFPSSKRTGSPAFTSNAKFA